MSELNTTLTAEHAASAPIGNDEAAAEIAGMLAQILAKGGVTAESDFFELGGDSLAAMELMVAIHTRYGVAVDPIEIFQTPHIRAFAALVVAFHQASEA